MSRVVVALGGNALLQRDERPGAQVQYHHVETAAAPLAAIAAAHALIVTHGNGPQVGLLALESAADPDLEAPYPFDTLGAETQGMIGYWLAQALRNATGGAEVVALVTQTVVDPADPAFTHPTKFVGRPYDEAEAHALVAARGWVVHPDGARWRRVVASPDPLEVVEVAVLERLVCAGVVPVCVGGGGVPVVREGGRLRGVEAVIDKDLASALVARALGADLLVMATDVAHVELGFGTPEARPLERVTPGELAAMTFAPGSMGPKVEAARRFVSATGGRAAIGALGALEGLVAGGAGTQVVPD
ncbi:MAG TPA: carbamate kinase [Acidimicrobiales bacterium]|nr:MAG: carbamate kinase [Actinobacteria bacterium 21-73-9]HQU27149.1 carbamate kinase [Acidimicrobiales bacterium]